LQARYASSIFSQFTLLWTASRASHCPYTTLFRSGRRPRRGGAPADGRGPQRVEALPERVHRRHLAGGHRGLGGDPASGADGGHRSEEHTSELQSRENLVCRLLLEKKKAYLRGSPY